MLPPCSSVWGCLAHCIMDFLGPKQFLVHLQISHINMDSWILNFIPRVIICYYHF